MRRILAAAVLAVAMSAVVAGQTSDGRAGRSQAEDLIALSQEFVKTSVGAVAVELGEVKMTPSGPLAPAEVKESWEAVGMTETKVRIDGDEAVVTGRVIFGAGSPEDKPLNASHRVRIQFHKHEGQWKLVKGCVGECRGRK